MGNPGHNQPTMPADVGGEGLGKPIFTWPQHQCHRTGCRAPRFVYRGSYERVSGVECLAFDQIAGGANDEHPTCLALFRQLLRSSNVIMDAPTYLTPLELDLYCREVGAHQRVKLAVDLLQACRKVFAVFLES